MANIKKIYDILHEHYGLPPWWSKNPFEVMVGAVLVQNTAWNNVQRTISDFGDNLTPEYVEHVTEYELENVIRSCGFCKAKAACLKRLAGWYGSYRYSQGKVMAMPKEHIRTELLAIKGIGAETADVILMGKSIAKRNRCVSVVHWQGSAVLGGIKVTA